MILPPAYVSTAPLQHVVVDGRDRRYRVYRPAGLSHDRAVPMVVVLHGGFGTGEQAERSYGWDAAANRHRLVVVYPDGVGRSWNAGNCCGPAQREGVDDVAFLKTVIARVTTTEHIDPLRVAVAGISNGGMMAYRMACDSGLPLRAVGSVSGTMETPCLHPAKTSLMEIHGMSDRNIPYYGGDGMGPAHAVTAPIPDVAARWRAIDGCGPAALRRENGYQTLDAVCPNGLRVDLVSIPGAGHQWPQGVPPPKAAVALANRLGIAGLDPPSQVLDATEMLYAFFFTR
jgi:polyhydroxybutyrate depolymerase